MLGLKYKKEWKARCTVANFLLGQANLAILKSYTCKKDGENIDLVGMFKSVKYKVAVEYAYFKLTNNMDFFFMEGGV